jgi:hypothetical protein
MKVEVRSENEKSEEKEDGVDRTQFIYLLYIYLFIKKMEGILYRIRNYSLLIYRRINI